MFFRSNRYSLSSNDVSISAKGNNQLRSSSAPPPGSITSENDLSLVEERLRIVKRNRVMRNPGVSYVLDESASSSHPPRGTQPPCSAYPTFDLASLPKYEQGLVRGLVAEVTDAIMFPTAKQG